MRGSHEIPIRVLRYANPKIRKMSSAAAAATTLTVCFNTNTNATKTILAFNKKLDSTKQNKKAPSPLQLISNTKFLTQSAVGVFALGFIDAGYSGDWSRIGVISRGTEDLLKAAAFLVVPLCIFLIILFFRKDNDP